MARIERTVDDLVADDPEMRTAVETLLSRSEDGALRWVEVKGEVTSGQWGRLIETGVLVDGEEGFEFADRSAVEAALAHASSGGPSESSALDSDDTDGDDEESSWSIYDKGAAAVTMVFFAAYSWRPLRDAIGGVVDIALGPLAGALPFYAVVMVLAMGTGLYSTLLQAILMDTGGMSEYQAKMNEIQEREQAARERDDQEALEEIRAEQREMLGDQLGMFTEQIRPMVWIMFLTIPVFLWMYWAVGIGANASAHVDLQPLVLPLRGTVQWTEGVLGPLQAWILWYFLCSMGFSQIIRKGLNIDMSPS